MWITIKKLLAQLLFWLYDFLDLIGDIFRLLVGLDKVGYTSDGVETEMSLLDAFMQHTVASKILFGLILIGVIIACVCGIVKVGKNIFKVKVEGERASHTVAVGQTFMAILSSVACIFFVLLFIAFANMLLQQVNAVTAPANGDTQFSHYLFDLSVESKYQLDYDHPLTREVPRVDENGNYIQAKDGNGDLLYLTNEYGKFVNEKGEIVDEKYKVPKYEMDIEVYYENAILRNADGEPILDENNNTQLVAKSGYADGITAKDLDFKTMSVNTIFGRHRKIMGWEIESMGYSVKPMVELESFNLFTAYLVAVVMLISLIVICLGMVKRLYDVIVLIFMMPLVCGTIPLDDGARFKAWREIFMSKIFLVFGAVLAINVFFQIAPIIELINLSAFTSSKLVQNIVKMFLYMGGALCINASQVLIARVLGTSADESRELAQSARTIMGGVTLGVGGIVGAKNMIFGGYNKYGRYRRGLRGLFGGRNNGDGSGTAGGGPGIGSPTSLSKPGAVGGGFGTVGTVGGGMSAPFTPSSRTGGGLPSLQTINKIMGSSMAHVRKPEEGRANGMLTKGTVPGISKLGAFKNNTKKK